MTQPDALLTSLNRSVPLPEEKRASPYLEIQAMYIVHNRMLRVGVAVLLMVIVALVALGWKFSQSVRDMKPLVVRVNESGEAVTAPYTSLTYRPREPEVRHFLMKFVQDHFSRVRATIQQAQARQLFFMNANLAAATVQHDSETKWVRKFLTSTDDEVEVYVTNVIVEDLQTSPYKARVEFDKVFRQPGDGREVKREKHSSSIQFIMLDQVPNQFIETNPLGLVITYFYSNQAF